MVRNTAQIYKKDHVDQKSGFSLGENRLKLNDRVPDLKIIDLEDVDGNPAGTSVQIKIELVNSRMKLQ